MSVYSCKVCGFRYDEWLGDSKNGVPPGIPFQRLTGSVCSTCGLSGGRHERLPSPPYKGLEAAYYDQFAGKAGILFYRGWIQAFDLQPAVLELGVGTGRIALELARQGISVCGIDNSPDMLGLAEKKKRRLGKGREHLLELMEQEALHLQLDRTFTHVLLTEGFLQHFTLRSEQRRLLQLIKEHLTEDGLVAIDLLLPPAGENWQTEQRKWVFPDKMVYQQVRGETSYARQRFRYSLAYATFIDSVEQPRYRVDREMALMLPGELVLLLESEQLEVTAMHENYIIDYPAGYIHSVEGLSLVHTVPSSPARGDYDLEKWTEGGYPFAGLNGRTNADVSRMTLFARKKTCNK
ncbi:methyltransferase domain-containing protein [Brevibacillus borstelensis]|uniref:methyltransferase domain-containing protein n=1 Tax=Brevibacillus borstelensis TaxID=45462 RepID=UPI0004F3BC71|nr:methyltransferase domain-containing protein [Brevibacillus borstelensis]KKX55917.1 methylase [Brevibacillus borstelensis cifa_chp40]